MSKIKWYFLLPLLLASPFWGCNSEEENMLNSDIPPDPEVAPPPLALGPLIPSITLGEIDASNPARIPIIVGGVGYRENQSGPGSSYTVVQYSQENLTIVEDEVVQGKLILEGSTLKADIAFIIDNTGSMREEIRGVRESVLTFVEALQSGSQDVSAGVVAFNDGLRAGFPNGVEASDARAKPAVHSYIDLSSDFSEPGDLYTFISSLTASDPGNNFDFPELAFAGVDYARRTFSWRDDAQRIYILITDDSAWGRGFPANNDKGIDEDYFTDVSLGQLLNDEGSVVHVYSPAPKPENRLRVGEYNVQPLAELTGGIWNELDRRGEFDLLELGIVDITLASARVEFVKNGDPQTTRSRQERVVVSTLDNGQVINGERTIELVY
ncbi:MAG: vWA domain-containing protein [Cyclobacteriaceae bacterium]